VHPALAVVTTFIDPAVSADSRLCLPGVGHYGSRYFGTEADDDAEAYFVADAALRTRIIEVLVSSHDVFLMDFFFLSFFL
jgi:hypothetical protein